MVDGGECGGGGGRGGRRETGTAAAGQRSHLPLRRLKVGNFDVNLQLWYIEHFGDSMVLPFRVFASAETLFYYAKHAKPTNKPLSREEIKALLAQTTAPPDTPQPPEKGERGSSKEGQGAGSTDNQVTAMSGAGRDTNSGDDELHIEHSERRNGALPIPISTGSPIGTLSDDQPLKVTKLEILPKPSALAGGKSFPPSASSAGADIEISDLDEGMKQLD